MTKTELFDFFQNDLWESYETKRVYQFFNEPTNLLKPIVENPKYTIDREFKHFRCETWTVINNKLYQSGRTILGIKTSEELIVVVDAYQRKPKKINDNEIHLTSLDGTDVLKLRRQIII